MSNGTRLMTVEITYDQVDHIGVVPQVDQAIPCDGAPSGTLHVVEKRPIIRAGRRVGWTVTGLG